MSAEPLLDPGTARLAEMLGYLLAQYERVVDLHALVVMDTPKDRDTHDRAVAAMRVAADPIRAELARWRTQINRSPS